jgi:hypothetical protein
MAKKNQTPSPDIGKKPMGTDGGGTYGHLPPASSFEGRKGGTSGGITESKTVTDIPWLPKKPK